MKERAGVTERASRLVDRIVSRRAHGGKDRPHGTASDVGSSRAESRSTRGSDTARALLHLVRGAPPDPRVVQLGTLDPRAILDIATRHQVEGFLYWSRRLQEAHTRSGSNAGVPVAISAMRRGYLHDSVRNVSLSNDLEAIARAFDARAIAFVVFKGPWLALRAYPDPGARPVGDIDLCVDEADYLAARDALATLGYAGIGRLPETADEALSRAHFGEQLRFASRGRRLVELHFRMVNIGPPGQREDWVWETARKLEMGSASIRVPGPEAMLVHLCLHANQHAFRVLRLLLDVRFALDHDGAALDLELLRTHVTRRRCGSAVYHALVLAKEMVGADPGPSLLAAVRPGPLDRALYPVIWRLRGVRALALPHRSQALEAPLLFLLALGSPREKLEYWRGLKREAGGTRSLVGRMIAMLRTRSSQRKGAVRSRFHTRWGRSQAPAERVAETGADPSRRSGDRVASRTRVDGLPRLRSDLIVREIDGDHVLYDPVRDASAILNDTARTLLEQCDGRRSVDRIAEVMADTYAIAATAIIDDVHRSLDRFVRSGWIDRIDAD